MIGLVILGFVGFAAVVLGTKGFSAEGLPLTSKKNITGTTARIIGGACMLFGLACLGFLFLIVMLPNR